MIKKIITTLVVALFITGCAHDSSEISTQYVSPITYADYNCKQVGAELSRLSRRASELAFKVDERASSDSTKMAVGMILLWPTLFFIKGDSPDAQEYGRIKGEYEALEIASIRKECGYEFKDITPPKKEEKKEDEEVPFGA